MHPITMRGIQGGEIMDPKGHPMKITRMKKCPFGTLEDVIK